MDPLPPILPAPVGAKPTGSGKLETNDLLLYTGGGSLVVGTQVFGKSYPHLATEVFSNVIGGGRVNVAAGQFKPSAGGLGLFVLPAPFGYADPVNYDLPPNYLANVNYNLNQRLGLPRWIGIPESSILKTLPDTHPDVKLGEYRLEGVRQIRRLRDFAARASVEQLVDLYRFASSPDAEKLVYYPDEVRNDLEVSIRARVGIAKGNELIHGASGATALSALVPAAAPTAPHAPIVGAQEQIRALHNPPHTKAPADPVGDPLAASLLARTNDPTADLSASDALRARAIRPLWAPPTSTLQQEANDRAPPLLRELASERADP